MKSKRSFAVACLAATVGVGAPSAASEKVTYTYDALGRMVIAASSGTVNNNQVRSICFDPAGNRLQYKSNAAGAIAACAGGTPAPTPTPTPTTPPGISIGDASASEGSSLTFTIRLSSAYGSNISVNYATAYGSAGSADLIAASGTITFTAGQTSRTITVATRNDTIFEQTETFVVNLSGATGGSGITDSQGVGTIQDNDVDEPMCGQYLC